MMNFTDGVLTDLQFVFPVVPVAALTWRVAKLVSLTDVASMILQVVSPVLDAALTWGGREAGELQSLQDENEYLRGVWCGSTTSWSSRSRTSSRWWSPRARRPARTARSERRRSGGSRLRRVTHVKGYLGTKGIRVLAEILGLAGGALDSFLGSKVEAAVHDLRLAERGLRVFGAEVCQGVAAPFGIDASLNRGLERAGADAPATDTSTSSAT